MKTVIVAGALVLMTPAAASAADKVPVTLDVTGCDGCTVMASWSKKGTAQSKVRGKTKKITNGTVSFNIPKGYWMYFTGTSPKAAVNAATIALPRPRPW